MNLTIGLWKHDTAWEQLLAQIGVSWSVVPGIESVSPDAYSAMIVNGALRRVDADILRAYLHEGGALLCDFGRFDAIMDCGTMLKHVASVEPKIFGPFAPSSIVDIHAPARILTVRHDAGETDTRIVQIFRIGDGPALSLPFDIGALLRSRGSRRKNFYAPKDRLPSETVADVSKGQLREIVTTMLEYLHHSRDLPFVHTWYYPDGKPSLFTFRVDTDRGSRAELTELHDVCLRHGIRGSWFADVKSHEDWLDFFSGFSTQEIGLHCYEHRTDETVDAVRANFSNGAALLRQTGFAVHGATAPTGKWNSAVDTVYRELGIRYSSEFSLVYDDLPSYPVIGNALSPVLQLPVHPVCVGSMRRSAFTAEQMKAYFRAWIDNRMQSREPVCIYHHPTHHHWDVMDDAFSYIGSLGIPCMTYGEYAAWWKKRAAAASSFTYTNGRLGISHGDVSELYYRISFPGREEIITQIDGTLDAAIASRCPSPAPIVHPADLMRARAFDWRHIVVNMLDRWYTFRS